MIEKLVKYEDSYAIVIDKSILEQLKIKEGTHLDVSTDGNAIIISPIRDEEKSKRVEEAMNQCLNQYGKVFKKLAE